MKRYTSNFTLTATIANEFNNSSNISKCYCLNDLQIELCIRFDDKDYYQIIK